MCSRSNQISSQISYLTAWINGLSVWISHGYPCMDISRMSIHIRDILKFQIISSYTDSRTGYDWISIGISISLISFWISILMPTFHIDILLDIHIDIQVDINIDTQKDINMDIQKDILSYPISVNISV